MNSELLLNAVAFAAKAHASQRRKYSDEPYIIHPVTVSKHVARFTGDQTIVIAALLHDVLEDNKDITPDMIKNEFGAEVLSLVDHLTDKFTKENYPALNREQRKKKELERQMLMPEDARLIKYADIIDNMPSIVEHDKSFASKYLPEKKAFLTAVTTTLYKKAWEEAMAVVEKGLQKI